MHKVVAIDSNDNTSAVIAATSNLMQEQVRQILTGTLVQPSTSMCHVGIAHLRLGQHRQAEGYLRASLVHWMELEDLIGQAVAYSHLGQSYQQVQQQGHAISCYQQAFCDFQLNR